MLHHLADEAETRQPPQQREPILVGLFRILREQDGPDGVFVKRSHKDVGRRLRPKAQKRKNGSGAQGCRRLNAKG
jgi:hypothetical protein